jgi:hypothetical protein
MSIVFITTLAQHLDNDEKYKEREKQTMYSLSRIFSYKLPVYGVISETYNDINWLPKQFFPFEKLLEIEITDINTNKSQKEFNSIKSLLMNTNLDDDAWIIKISGRYLIYNDLFINTVKEQPSSIKAVIRTCDNHTQMYTFLFALRFKFFKDFFSNILPDNINLEKILFLYLQHNLSDEEIKFVDNLGIICNIADCNVFSYF